MNLLMYQVDAFTDRLFGGNPAAVIPLTEWLSDDLMQKIAQENNLSETAFFVNDGESFRIRWFTPAIEINLAGHPTLAAAHVIFNHLDFARDRIDFVCQSGKLTATRGGDIIRLDFPAHDVDPMEAPQALTAGLGHAPKETFLGRDYLARFDSEADILALRPDFGHLAELDCLGIIVTAPGKTCDFVSRFFAPRAGINEDPVTGSAHTLLVPFWAKRLGKNILHARQVSRRGGELFCEYCGDRVFIGGRAVTFLEATVTI